MHQAKHPSDISQVAYSPDGKWLAVTGGNRGDDYTIRIWNTTNWTESQILSGHLATVNDIAWSPDGRQLVSASSDTGIVLWDPIAGEKIRVLGGQGTLAVHISWSADGQTVASTGNYGCLRLWHPDKEQSGPVLNGPYRSGHQDRWRVHRDNRLLAAAPGSGLLVTGQINGESLQLWSTRDQAPVGESIDHPATLRSLCWSADMQHLASANDDGRVHVLSIKDRRWIRTLARHKPSNSSALWNPISVAWSPDNQRLASTGGDQRLVIGSAHQGEDEDLLEIDLPGGGYSLAFSPKGEWIAVEVLLKVYIFDASSGEQQAVFGNCDGFSSWSPSGDWLALGRTGEITLIEVGTWREARTLKSSSPSSGTGQATFSITWNNDGSQLIACAGGQRIESWTAAGEALPPFDTGTTGIDLIAWCTETEQLAGLGRDGTLRVWDWETRKEQFLASALSSGDVAVFNSKGELIHGDIDIVDREFIYLVQGDDGVTEIVKYYAEVMRQLAADEQSPDQTKDDSETKQEE